MPRKPENILSIQDLIRYYVSQYYNRRAKSKGIRQDDERHLTLVLEVEDEFHKEIKRKYPQWDDEEKKSGVRQQIDLLTGIFSKKEKQLQKEQEQQKFRSEVEHRFKNSMGKV